MHLLRMLFGPSLTDLERRVTRLERVDAEREADLTNLTDKLTNQLKSMRQRSFRVAGGQSREELLNEAIKARRKARWHLPTPPTNGGEDGVRG